MAPITKIWFMKLKPSVSASDQAFKAHWTEVLKFVNTASGSNSAAHQLWQHISVPQYLVMISGFPSQESTDKADSEFVPRYGKRLAELVENMGLKELQLDSESITSSLLDAPVLSIETFSVSAENQRAFETKEREKKAETIWPVVGEWDIWPQVCRAKKGLDAEMGIDKDWVRLTGWENEEKYMEKNVRDINAGPGAELSPDLLKKVFLKKVME